MTSPDSPPPESSERTSNLSLAASSILIVLGTLLAVAVAGVIGVFLWFVFSDWTKGRPLRGRRSRRKKPIHTAQPLRKQAAIHWRHMAQEEHESIAAFSEIALDLMAVGAPQDLIVRCHQAALEEAAHTEVCLGTATELDGAPSTVRVSAAMRKVRRRPGWRTAALVRLATESYVDGALGEGSSAYVLAALAKSSDEPKMKARLKTLAKEEMGHAQLSTDIVRWCLASGGPIVAKAVVWADGGLRMPLSDHADLALRNLGVPDDRLRADGLAWARDLAGRRIHGRREKRLSAA